jgi:multicomponent Na+:H+ antiporter subunit B
MRERALMMIYLIHAISVLIAVSAIAVIRVRDLFGLIALLSVYSGLLAVAFVLMGAVDVALHGGGGGDQRVRGLPHGPHVVDRPVRADPLPPPVASCPGSRRARWARCWSTASWPCRPSATRTPRPCSACRPYYIENSYADMATPNVVAAVLADYRSLDTLIEAAVVFAAALACLLILLYRDDPTVR